jgi:hypothetical protein
MDNHKWALSAWARGQQATPAWLLHADHHWDGVDLFAEDPVAQSELLGEDLAALDQRIAEENCVQYDAFIAPAVRRGLFQQLHFYCTQRDGSDWGVDQSLCDGMGVRQVVHESLESFAAIEPGSAVGRRSHPSLFASDAAPNSLGRIGHPLSLSFGYSGTESDTRGLAKIVVPQVVEWRGLLAPR